MWDRELLCPQVFHMVSEANLLVLLWPNQPFLMADTGLFEWHWKLGGVIDSGEISWQVLKSSCSFIHTTHTNVFIFLNRKYTLPLPLWNTHAVSLSLSLSHTHTHTQSMGPGGVVSARSCSLPSWVQLVTWAACLNNSVIPKASSLRKNHGTAPKTHFV